MQQVIGVLLAMLFATNTMVSEVKAEPEPENTHIKITIGGDFMLASYRDETTFNNFNGYVNTHEPTYFLENVRSIFEADDFTIANLENVLTDRPLKETNKNYSPAYWYKSKTSNTDILTSSSVEIVNISNNHTMDYGQGGKDDTIAALDNAGLMWGDTGKTLYFEKDGFKIALICSGLWSTWQVDTIIPRIYEAAEQSDFQIVYYHGGTERIHAPEKWKVDASHKLVDNGADLVIGNHPHVLQPRETYNGVDIIYSMGNFCYGGSKKCENRTILYSLDLEVSPDHRLINKTAEIIPCYVYTEDYKPGVITDEAEKDRVLRFMSWELDSPV